MFQFILISIITFGIDFYIGKKTGKNEKFCSWK
jgi:hypothetical protein